MYIHWQWLFFIGITTYCLGVYIYAQSKDFSGIRAYVSSILMGASLMMMVWGGYASASRPIIKTEIVGDVVEKKLPNGTIADVVIYEDENGKHEVNINAELGIKIPNSALTKKMRLERLNYEPLSWGLKFDTHSRYKVLQDK